MIQFWGGPHPLIAENLKGQSRNHLKNLFHVLVITRIRVRSPEDTHITKFTKPYGDLPNLRMVIAHVYTVNICNIYLKNDVSFHADNLLGNQPEQPNVVSSKATGARTSGGLR